MVQTQTQRIWVSNVRQTTRPRGRTDGSQTMSGTRQYRQLSAETLDTLLRLITEGELTPKQIAERAGVPRQKVYEYHQRHGSEPTGIGQQ